MQNINVAFRSSQHTGIAKSAGASGEGHWQLVVIDPRVSSYQQLIAGILPNTSVLLLDSQKEAIEQITQALQEHKKIDSLHLIAHGAPGQLFLGRNPWDILYLDNLAEQVADWRQFLTDRAQVLVYGCETGADRSGREFVQKLQSLTGRVVAASSKFIGRVADEINWNLDVRTANFLPATVFSDHTLADYAGLLGEPYLVKDINPTVSGIGIFATGAGSDLVAGGGASLGSTLFFSANDGKTGSELWRTDGTNGGTQLVQDLIVDDPPRFPNNLGSNPKGLFAFGNNVYFAANGGSVGGGLTRSNTTGDEIYKTDSTGITILKDIDPLNILGAGQGSFPDSFTPIDNKFFFRASNIGERIIQGLYVSDGTAEGTGVVPSSFTGIPAQLTGLGNKLIFVAKTKPGISDGNEELWSSDGSSTSLVIDINGDPNKGSDISSITKVGGSAYFVATGGTGKGLWKTDGTTAGTTKINTPDSFIFNSLTEVNGSLFFSDGSRIFKANPDDSVSRIDDFGSNQFNSSTSLFNSNGTLFFTRVGRSAGPDQGKVSLWKSDGTALGIARLSPEGQDVSFSSKNNTTAFLGDTFYFVNDNPATGNELWQSDGTPGGTKLVKDINPGINDSGIQFIGKAFDRLYFAANNGTTVGRELWAIQGDAVGPKDPRRPENPGIPLDGFVTGGDLVGRLLNDEVETRRDRRKIGFEEIKSPNNPAEPGQTWVVIHGWNSNTGTTIGADNGVENIGALVESVRSQAGANDRVLALDWREAAVNRSTNALPDVADFANIRAASWITPVAEFAVRKLQEKYGIDAVKAQESLNLVGHSFGAYIGSEIGRIYRDGGTLVDPFPLSPETANTAVAANSAGARTITALDPASAANVPLFTYDLDGRAFGTQGPQNFADTSVFSRSYNGAQSVAGNEAAAVTADEAIQMDFGNTQADVDEHGRVIEAFAKVFGQSELIGDLLGGEAYQSISTLPINDFASLTTPQIKTNGFRGILNIEKSDSDSAVNNRANVLIGQATTGNEDNIAIGTVQDDDIQGTDTSSSTVEGTGDVRYGGTGDDKLFGEGGDDTIRGKSGNDTLIGGVGNDVLLGYDGIDTTTAADDDVLYGGIGKDILSGGKGSDTFVFQAGDGSISLNDADAITDFQLRVDKIGLISLDFSQITIQDIGGVATITFGNEFLAKVKGQGVSAAQLQSPDIFTIVSPDIFQVT
jgi:ELWxxDGT repeat protein